jgi:hypothetical protein
MFKFARGTVVLTVAANVLDFTVGESAEHGLFSTTFAAANTVDLTTGLGLPAVGAAAGVTFGGPPGALIGGGIGLLLDVGWKFYDGGRLRNTAVGGVDDFYQLTASGVDYMIHAWASGSAPLTIYPETIPSYEPFGIQPTYPYNPTIGLPSYYLPIYTEEDD